MGRAPKGQHMLEDSVLHGTVLTSVCILQERGSHGIVALKNTGHQTAHFCVVAESSIQGWGQPQGQGTGLPDWLDVFPLSGAVPPEVHSTLQPGCMCIGQLVAFRVYDSSRRCV